MFDRKNRKVKSSPHSYSRSVIPWHQPSKSSNITSNGAAAGYIYRGFSLAVPSVHYTVGTGGISGTVIQVQSQTIQTQDRRHGLRSLDVPFYFGFISEEKWRITVTWLRNLISTTMTILMEPNEWDEKPNRTNGSPGLFLGSVGSISGLD